MKGAFRSVQTPSAPSAEEQDDDEEEEVISTFGGFLMKADSEGIPGPSTFSRSESERGRCWRTRWPSRARTGCCCGAPSQHVGGPASDSGEIDTPDSLRQIIAASTFFFVLSIVIIQSFFKVPSDLPEVPPNPRSHSEKWHFALPERKVHKRYTATNQCQSDKNTEVPPSRRFHSEKWHFALSKRKVDQRYLELGTLENESGDVRCHG